MDRYIDRVINEENKERQIEQDRRIPLQLPVPEPPAYEPSVRREETSPRGVVVIDYNSDE
jgi:hypothetical protein